MPANQQEIYRGKVAPRLMLWSRDPKGAGERSVIVRIGYSTDPKQAAAEIEQAGARVESAGRGVITAVVSPPSLGRVSELPWITSIDEPRELFPKLSGF